MNGDVLVLGSGQVTVDAWGALPTGTRYVPVIGGAHVAVRLPDGTRVRCDEVRKENADA